MPRTRVHSIDASTLQSPIWRIQISSTLVNRSPHSTIDTLQSSVSSSLVNHSLPSAFRIQRPKLKISQSIDLSDDETMDIESTAKANDDSQP
ncbi:hypothetical protein L2E82_32503 [Cichorium intybus]|uniref:Uncharacterized protein n=1 Tax=Cichorium intybus TaxID=13427 RepID=A0ACB9BGZ6_CICIN|nr:hypothetical protein L2E82_32503 [Cichorium intybus]